LRGKGKMKTITKTKPNNVKFVNFVPTTRDEVLREVRRAMWEQAKPLYSMGSDSDVRQDKLKAFSLIGNQIDKFIDKFNEQK
jgi:hypothetical protein